VFQPDEPDNGSYGEYSSNYINDDPAACQTGGSYNCYCYKWSKYWVDGGQLCYELDNDWNTISSGQNVCSCNTYNAYHGWSNYYGNLSSYYCANGGGGSVVNTLSERERQERLCKYDGANPSYSGYRGPNSYCPGTDILPMTANPNTVISKITSMVADGATNIHQGAIWGFHTISPTEPFTQGSDYDTATSKVMILMTDGENTYYGDNNMNGSDFLQAYGHYYNAPDGNGTPYQLNGSRLGYSVNNYNQMTAVMNILTEETCQNAKDAGIIVYTIGLNPPNNPTRTMLENCSSGAGYAYFPTAANELNSVFAEIASKLAPLRLAQ
jgi:hypothetical protein